MSIQQSINQTLSLWSLVSPYAEGKRTEKRLAAESASRKEAHKAEVDTFREKFDVAATRAEQMPVAGDKKTHISSTKTEDAISAREKAVQAGEEYLSSMTVEDISPESIASLSDRLTTMREEIKQGQKKLSASAKKQEAAEAAAREELETEQRRQAFWNQITEGIYLRDPNYKTKKETK